MNTGMQDAFNLAWKLALVIRGVCADSLLDSYSPERSFVGDVVLKNAGRLTAVGTMKNPAMQSLRNMAGHFMFGLAPVRHAFADSMTEVAIGYPHSPLNGPGLHGSSGPKPGERVTPVSGQVPVGSDGEPTFALFAEENEGTADLIAQFKGLLDAQVRAPLSKEGIWLVRPDGYVACSAHEPAAISTYLGNLVH
jgi:hypothetical protein